MKGEQTEKEGYCVVFPTELGPLLRKHIVKRIRVLRQEEWEIRNGEGRVEEMTRVCYWHGQNWQKKNQHAVQ